MKKKQLKISESEYAKNLGVAASAGAVIGGTAFATAAYSTRIWETDSNEHNETLETVEESSADGMIPPETISTETSNPVAENIAYTTHPIPPTESEEINIIGTENNEIIIENIEYPDEGETLQSDMQNIIELAAGEIMDIPLPEDTTYNDDTIIEDSQQFFI